MKKIYIQPTLEIIPTNAEHHLCAGSPKTYEMSHFGNKNDTHGNPDWVNEGHTGKGLIDWTDEGGTGVIINGGSGLDSRSKGHSIWDEDDDY